ncbi:MAG: hypothetical protein ACR2FG_03525 [Marmoricola sp.]
MTQYPGPDPDDPFSRPPNEQGSGSPAPPPDPPYPGTEETAPVQGSEEPGYWEREAARNEQAQQPDGPAGSADPAVPPRQPEQPSNPWAGYGQPTPSYQQGSGQPPYQQEPGQPVYQQPGQPGYPAGYGQPGYPAYGAPPPNHPQATTAMVLGLVSLIGGCICGLPFLAGPFAWVIGSKAKREIAASNGQLGGEGSAQAGFIMGIIASVLLVLAVIAVLLVVVVGIASDSSSSTTTQY